MAEESSSKKAPRKRKTPVSVREHAEKQAAKREAPKKSTKLRSKIHRPLSTLRSAGKKEFTPVKVPEKKGVHHLNKRVHFMPKFIRESWGELKLVVWPDKKTAARLTLAVFIFSAVFAIFVQILDYGFNKLFKEILLK